MIPNRMVLDTNVCLDLFVFDDPRWTPLMVALRDGSVEAVTREDCRAEWLLVLAYARFGLTHERRLHCIARFDALIRCLPLPGGRPGAMSEAPAGVQSARSPDERAETSATPGSRHADCAAAPRPGPAMAVAPVPRCSDADDQKFLETARDASAAMLITKDKALLKLAGKCRRAGMFAIIKPDGWIAARGLPAADGENAVNAGNAGSAATAPQSDPAGFFVNPFASRP